MTTYVTENMICDCCGAVVLGVTSIKNRHVVPLLQRASSSMHVTGDICEECEPVLQEAFNNIAELQRMKRGPQEVELPEVKVMRLEQELEAVKNQVQSLQNQAGLNPQYSANRPYGAPPGLPTSEETKYQMEQIRRQQQEDMKARYPHVNYGLEYTVSPALDERVWKEQLKKLA